VYQYARLGLNDKQIAEKLGVSHDTYFKYIKRYNDFAEAREKGKEKPNFEVINSCYRLARGFEKDLTQEKVMMIDGKPEVVQYTQKIYIPPNQRSIEFWLTNREKEHFKAVAQLTKEAEGTADTLDLEDIATAIRNGDTE
jgi:DNA-binding XRE family transcriptional regulator